MKPSIFIAALFLLGQIVHADDPCEQPSPEEMAKAAGVELPRRPWHVANIWWTLDKPVEHFTRLDMEVTIDRDIPETYNLYVSPCGIAKINGLQFYGGLQTNINGWANKESRTRVHRGHGGIFSRWSADKTTPIGLEHVEVAADECLVESAGYEGEFASVRRPIQWSQGTYRWSVVKGDSIDFNEKRATWFECQITNLRDNSTLNVGKLLFEGEDFTFWAKHSAFVEVYATGPIPKSNIPKVTVRFGWPMINGKPASVMKADAYYPDPKKGIPGSPDCAKVRADGEACVVEVGAIFQREESQRRHPLEIKH